MKISILFIVLMMNVWAVQAAPVATIIERGYYQFTSGSERMARPSISSGYVASGKTQLIGNTQRIPLQKGRLFGFRFRITGLQRNVGVIPLELVVTHAEMKKLDGSLSTGYRYNLNLKLSNGMVEDKTGYRINEDYEMVEGDWEFEFRFLNKTLLKQTFTTYLQ